MFDQRQFNQQLAKYVCTALVLVSIGCSTVSLFSALTMIPGLMDESWAPMHILAVFGMAGCFAVLAACFAVLYDLADGYFRTEADE